MSTGGNIIFTHIPATTGGKLTIRAQDANPKSYSQALIDMQYLLFNDHVLVNLSSNHSGQKFPNGTLERPVNNLADAIEIARDLGFGIIRKVLGTPTPKCIMCNSAHLRLIGPDDYASDGLCWSCIDE